MQQATKATQKQLAYLAYWGARGYQFGRDDVILESTCIPPRSADIPRPIELAVTAILLISIVIWMVLQ